MARIGLLGGSFNPAHRGHRRISLAAIRALGLDEVWWLVSPGNPLKEGARTWRPSRHGSNRRGRRRAARPSGQATSRSGGTRYTVETLDKLKRRYPNHDFIWLMGLDNLRNFHLWRDWRGLPGGFRLRSSRGPAMIAAPTRRARWAGSGGLSTHRARRNIGRSGVYRRYCCFACHPIRRPPPRSARSTPTGISFRPTCFGVRVSECPCRPGDPLTERPAETAAATAALPPTSKTSTRSFFSRSTTTRLSRSSASRSPASRTSPTIW